MIRQRRPSVVVIGNGRSAACVVEEVLGRAADRFTVTLFGDPCREAPNLAAAPSLSESGADFRPHLGVRAERVERNRRLVVGRPARTAENGRGRSVELEEPYDRLVLATGARPEVPPLPGLDREGVHVLRAPGDAAALAERTGEVRRAVVLGGGDTALEAAGVLLRRGAEVTVATSAAHLLDGLLDADAASVLRLLLDRQGVRVLVRHTPAAVAGGARAEAVTLHEGPCLVADLVVVAADLEPAVEVARAAGLKVGRAVLVDDQLRTSDPDVFAVGGCAEHRGRAVGPGDSARRQARVLADVLTGANPGSRYPGPCHVVTLPGAGVGLTAMGEVSGSAAEARVLVHADPTRGLYRKLVLRDGRLAGAVVLGDPAPVAPLRRLFDTQGPVSEASLDGLLRLLDDAPKSIAAGPDKANKVELMKRQKDGLDALPDVLRHAGTGNWQELTEDDKQRFKWHGLFFRKQTPGHFMLRLRMSCGFTNARQFRVIADLSDEFGKGFCDVTTRQQIQLRWFTIGDVPELWRRLDEVGLTSKQTGMDNVRGVCGCPLSGLTPHELFDASPAARELTSIILDNKEFTNLPRKFNVTVTGCLENCCHTETQDVALVPAYRELDGRQVNGFNLLVGGKQGSGGYVPARPLDVFARPEEAAALAAEVVRVFRDHGGRETRNRARLAFLVEDRGLSWFRAELERRRAGPLHRAGTDLRKPRHVDHLGIHPQKRSPNDQGPALHSVGLLVPVGRITTAQLRGVADLAERYGNGDVRLTVQQNLVVPNVPEDRLGALTEEPLLKELPFDPSPVMRGLVACVGSDYCHFALIETKGWAVEVARELERRTQGRKVLPLTIHWSGCAAGCGLHQAADIGLQGCRSRVNGEVVDAAHVYVHGKAGPGARAANDLMYDVPCDRLADALEPLVKYLPR